MRSVSIAWLFALLGGCGLREPNAVLTIEDPSGLAVNADALAVGSDPSAPSRTPLGRGLPVRLVVTRPEEQRGARLWVEALAGEVVVGRAAVLIDITRSGGAARVELEEPCDEDIDCATGFFCDGAESCVDRMCVAGDPPCPSAPVSCAATACVESDPPAEDGGGCEITPDHDACIAQSGARQICNPSVGCIEGDLGCGDGIVNPFGLEDCDDGNEFDDDGCSSFCRLEPGWACTEATVLDASTCVTSCLDGIPAGEEECDTAATDNCGVCLLDCTLFRGVRGCGDGFTCGAEECDLDVAGVLSNLPCDGCCRSDCQWQRCGDLIVDPGEACDEAIANGCYDCSPAEVSVGNLALGDYQALALEGDRLVRIWGSGNVADGMVLDLDELSAPPVTFTVNVNGSLRGVDVAANASGSMAVGAHWYRNDNDFSRMDWRDSAGTVQSSIQGDEEDLFVAINTGGDVAGVELTGSLRLYTYQSTGSGSFFWANAYGSSPSVVGVALDDAGRIALAAAEGPWVYMQRYDLDGNAFTLDGTASTDVRYRATTATGGVERDPRVAFGVDGSFAVVFSATERDGDGYGVVLVWVNAEGEVSETLVNVTSVGDQIHPMVDINDTGEMVIAWLTPGGSHGVLARRFRGIAPTSGEIIVGRCPFVSRDFRGALTLRPDGSFVAAWTAETGCDDGQPGRPVYVSRVSVDDVLTPL